MNKSLFPPKRLRIGETLGIIAPAGKVAPHLLQEGRASLEKLGYRVIFGRHVEKGNRYFAGSDKERADDFLEMMQNKEVRAIFCARGGSGSARIIPYLTHADIPNKIFVGSSDITTLLLYLTKTRGLVTFHGPMPAMGPTWASEPLQDYLFRVLSGEAVSMHTPEVVALKPGRAEGILTGGCLSLLCTTIGTPYEIDTEDTILFIEDIGEPAYRVDRMLYYLKTIKKFNTVRGVVFGQMPECQKELLPEIILEIFAEFDFPILFSFPSGHGNPIFTLPFGVPVCVDSARATLTMLTPAVS